MSRCDTGRPKNPPVSSCNRNNSRVRACTTGNWGIEVGKQTAFKALPMPSLESQEINWSPAQNNRECFAAEIQPERAKATKSSGTPDCSAAIEKADSTVLSHAQEKLLCSRMWVLLFDKMGKPGARSQRKKTSQQRRRNNGIGGIKLPSPKSAINPCTGHPSDCN